jgi:pimeloyl-ACP methyl ester carboxylesterase
MSSSASLVASLVGLLLLGAVGCAPGQTSLEGDSAEEDNAASSAPRRLLLCQQGLSDRTTGWDKGLFAVCLAAEDAGIEVIWDGEYPAFGALNEKGAYIHLVGFSWGGKNISDIAERLRKDLRVSASHSIVKAMVLFDPYQPQAWQVNVPNNVRNAWVYRQSETTDGDCSMTVSLGFGFNGLEPHVKSPASTHCAQYDLDRFLGEVGHCDTPSVARSAALHNLTTLSDYPEWAQSAEACSN